MIPKRLLRRLAAAAALVGVLAGAVWPLVAQGKPSKAGLPVVICTATGFHVVSGSDPGYPVPADSSKGTAHCTLCLAQPAPALPSSALVLPAFLPIAIAGPVPAPGRIRREPDPRLLPPSHAPPPADVA